MASSGARMLSVAFWYAVAVLLIISAVWFLGCTRGPFKRGFEEHPEEAGICAVKIENQTPYTAELRSASSWHRGKDGLMPHTSGTLELKQGKRYTLVLRMEVNGLAKDEPYGFFIPRGLTNRTITLGGLQIGVLYNMCVDIVEVFPPNSAQSIFISPGGKAEVSVMPGERIFVIYFDRARQHWTESIAKINHIRGDQFFDGEPVDWIGYIVPSLRSGGTIYLPDNPAPTFR